MTLIEFAKLAVVRGKMEHKGKTISREVKSLADRLRERDPSMSDEKAYRISNDIFASYVSHKKKSKYSGLKREGGKTKQPLSKEQ
jgi:hypothetical protein